MIVSLCRPVPPYASEQGLLLFDCYWCLKILAAVQV